MKELIGSLFRRFSDLSTTENPQCFLCNPDDVTMVDSQFVNKDIGDL